MRISKVLTLLFLLSASYLFAQEQEVDSLANKRLVQFGAYLDYGKLLQTLDDDASKWEVGGEVLLDQKWQITGEYGQWKITPEAAIENGSYLMDGSYLRYGAGFIPYVDAESRLGIGLRYSQASFRDDVVVTFTPDSGLQEDLTENYDRRDLQATWYEVVFYSDKMLNKFLTVGFTARLRLLQDYDEQEGVDIQLIPGYGNPQGDRNFAINLFLKIPL